MPLFPKTGRSTLLAVLLCLALGLAGSLSTLPIVHRLMLMNGFLGNETPIRIMAEDVSRGFRHSPPVAWLQPLEEKLQCCEGVAAIKVGEAALRTDLDARLVSVAEVGPRFLPLFGVRQLAGSLFGPESFAAPGATALVTSGFARASFGGVENAVGKSLVLDGKAVTIIGVVPSSFARRLYPAERFDIVLALNARRHASVDIFGILGEGSTRRTAEQELLSRVTKLGSSSQTPDSVPRPAILPANEFIDSRGQSLLQSAALTGLLLLLITCSNVVHLVLAHAISRRRARAIRRVLGATPWHLVRSWIWKSLVLAAASTFAAIILARWGIDGMNSRLPNHLQWLRGLHLGIAAWLAGFAISFIFLVAVGVIPLLRRSSRGWAQDLRLHHQEVGHQLFGIPLSSLHIVSMAALSTLLCVGAYLVVGSTRNIDEAQIGFDSEGLYAAKVKLPAWKYPESESRASFFRNLTAAISRIPGVSSVAITSVLPSESGFYFGQIDLSGPGIDLPPLSAIGSAAVSTGYFRTLGQNLVAGREYAPGPSGTPGNDATSIIVSTAVVEHMGLSPGSALGRKVRFGDQSREIIGVARAENVPGSETLMADMKVYWPLSQFRHEMKFVVRASNGDLPNFANLVRGFDPDVVLEVEAIDYLLLRSFADIRFLAYIFSLLTLLTLAIALLGVFSVLSNFVARRRQELALRLAVGADRGILLRWLVSKAMGMTFVGIGVGLLVSFPLGLLLSSQLYGLQPGNLGARLFAALLVIFGALIAAWFPANRALRIDPNDLLKAD